MITENQFKSYEEVRQSGITNMFDVRVVNQLTGLNKEQIKEIMLDYSSLKSKYYPNDEGN